MKKNLKSIFNTFGLNTLYFKDKFGSNFYYNDLKKLKDQKGDDLTFPFGTNYPILHERDTEAGTMNGHYFYQDLYVASRIFANNPNRHVDIGSRIDGFVSHVAAFRPIEVLDIRKQNSKVKNISFKQADLMQLPNDMINYCDSISSLHALEHFGLGRYGDTIDYWGHLKGIQNITEILKKGGRFYFSSPIGSQKIEFNAHRVFSLKYLIEIFNEKFNIERFSYVEDVDNSGDFHENVELIQKSIDSNFGCKHGCGIFELIKK